MDVFKRSTKQIAAKYKENLTYWYRPHYLRRWKLILFISAVIGSFAYALYPHNTGLYNTGPLSEKHARFEQRCDVCHTNADPNLLPFFKSPHEQVKVETASGKTIQQGERAMAAEQPAPSGFLAKVGLGKLESGIARTLKNTTSFEEFDKACVSCHQGYNLHQPQLATLPLAHVMPELTGAKVDTCSDCHWEHRGPGPMNIPASDTCVKCHNDLPRVEKTFVTWKADGKPVPKKGEIRYFEGDETRRFIPPRDNHVPVKVNDFAKTHPDFGYEQDGLEDPGRLYFNHSRHYMKDVRLKGAEMDCRYCHKPTEDGAFIRPVEFSKHCADCHSLRFSPDMPELTVPHRKPEEVVAALSGPGLSNLIREYAVKVRGIGNEEQIRQFVFTEQTRIQQRFNNDARELQRAVFETGYPAGQAKQDFAACTKCHVKLNYPQGEPKNYIKPTNVPQRWLTRGPFTHARHVHMECTQCHTQSRGSNRTEQISLPPKTLCATCHRPLEGNATAATLQPQKLNVVDLETTHRQMTEGGVRADCQYCHSKYHAPPEAKVFARDHQLILSAPLQTKK